MNCFGTYTTWCAVALASEVYLALLLLVPGICSAMVFLRSVLRLAVFAVLLGIVLVARVL